jgi:hypothetical protein
MYAYAMLCLACLQRTQHNTECRLTQNKESNQMKDSQWEVDTRVAERNSAAEMQRRNAELVTAAENSEVRATAAEARVAAVQEQNNVLEARYDTFTQRPLAELKVRLSSP